MESLAMDLDADLVELAPYVPPAPAAPLQEMAFRKDAWSAEEREILRAMFEADATFDEIADRLGRGRAGVVDQAYMLGLRRNTNRPWSELEEAELVRRYGEEPASTIAQALGRGVAGVYCRAQLLGLSEPNPPPYTPWEDAQIRAGWAAALPPAHVAALVGRPLCGVFSRASKLGIRHPNHPDDWSQEEMARALELANEGHLYLRIIEILASEGFPRRTKNGFGQKLRILGYGRGWGRRWLPDEDELLRRAYAEGSSLTPLLQRLGRTKCSIRWRAKELGLQGSHKNRNGWRVGPDWTEEEEGKLRALYGTMKNKDLAKVLGRSVGSVNTRAHVLGLEHGWIRAFTAEEDRAFGIAWRQGLGLADLASAMDRQLRVIWKHAGLLGLSFSDPARPARPKKTWNKVRPTLEQILALEPLASPVAATSSPPSGLDEFARGALLCSMSDEAVADFLDRPLTWVQEQRSLLQVAA